MGLQWRGSGLSFDLACLRPATLATGLTGMSFSAFN
jgi:hypothetical protein